jgi:hypothetical protein
MDAFIAKPIIPESFYEQLLTSLSRPEAAA